MESEHGDQALGANGETVSNTSSDTSSNTDTSAALDALDALDAVQRAEILTHTRYPKLGRWYPPTFGLLGAVFVAAYAAPLWLTIPVWIATLFIAGLGMGWYIRRRGVMPDMRRAPGALRRQAVLFFCAYTVVIAVISGLYFAIGWWAASLATFVLLTALITWYEARFYDTARKVEAEAGLAAPTSGMQ